ncbi:sensor histidine kinase [Paenibacillus lemnae]|uniref:Histidine kinase n=1 Tax=Paenibacillus lemnae TaxID=1330551 RepID=A0A848M3P0_PAELE|nr:sensor histidine kinase [Paenibacillus lemnae]NMO94712.1 histidine kinase [Paenibacillus lemnae]
MEKTNLFKKILAILWLLLVPVTLMFSYSNYISVQVVKTEIEENSRNRLSFFMRQVDNEMDKFVTSLGSLSKNPSIRQFINMEPGADPYPQFQSKLSVYEELSSLNIGSWRHSFTVFAPEREEAVTTHHWVLYSEYFIRTLQAEGREPFRWFYDPSSNSSMPSSFVWRTIEPFSAIEDVNKADMVSEIRVDIRDIQQLLTEFKQKGTGDPFLYHPQSPPITNLTAQRTIIDDIGLQFPQLSKGAREGNFQYTYNKSDYMVSFASSASLGWTLIDYVPLEQTLAPIKASRDWFWICMILLVVLSASAAYLLYRNVQVPIRKLIIATKRLRMGDYSNRLQGDRNDEFGFLFTQFNTMIEQIEDLIGHVYEEKLRSKEATLKQLQSQINPHFLYNCLFFIKNMTRLGQHEAVMAMSVKLGEFFRYTTRVDEQDKTLGEEIRLIDNYLSIQNMRMKRFRYEIDVPEEMEELIVPRLLLQPIVENAVIYAIEMNPGEGIITVKGTRHGNENQIVIEDNGKTMTQEKLTMMQEAIYTYSGSGNESLGLRNVHQRLQLKFGANSGLFFEISDSGGLCVLMRWQIPQMNQSDEEV